jgi:hypothetical protein
MIREQRETVTQPGPYTRYLPSVAITQGTRGLSAGQPGLDQHWALLVFRATSYVFCSPQQSGR